MEREAALLQSQAALKPRPLVSAVNRTPINTPESKMIEITSNKPNDDAKDRMEQFKLQKNIMYKKNIEQCVTPSGKPTLQSSAEGNIMRRIVTSTPIAGNSQIIKLIGKPSPGKIF